MRLAADNQLIVDYDATGWRLFKNGDTGPESRIIVQADQRVHFESGYAARRSLPERLAPGDVAEVVLGWSESDACWHLGFVLKTELAEVRGNRWTGIAHWNESLIAGQNGILHETASALAGMVGAPLRVIDRRPAAPPAPMPLVLPTLPMALAEWKLEQSEGALLLKQAGMWSIRRLGRVVWYLFWTALFLTVSAASLTANLGLPRTGILLPEPSLLPYLGIAAGLIIALLLVKVTVEWLSEPDKIAINADSVTATRSGRIRWALSRDEISAVVVSEVAGTKKDKRTVYYGEINLKHADKEAYKLVIQIEEELQRQHSSLVDGDSHELDTQVERSGNTLMPIVRIDSALQGIGAHIAQRLGQVPLLLDERNA